MKVKIKVLDGVRIIPIADLLYIEANSPYSYVHLKNETKVFSVDNLKLFDDKLKDFGFFRIHKRYLINVSSVNQWTKNAESFVELEGGTKLKVSRSKKQEFCQYLERFYL